MIRSHFVGTVLVYRKKTSINDNTEPSVVQDLTTGVDLAGGGNSLRWAKESGQPEGLV